MGNAKLLTDKDGDNRVWLNAILHWPKDATEDYAALHGIEKSVVSAKLGMSGECCCGAYAAPGERDRLKMHFPEHEDWISWMERQVEEAGKWSHWGAQAPKKLPEWENMPGLDPEDELMCGDCKPKEALLQ